MKTGDRIELGYINGVVGLKGQLKVFSFTSPRNQIFAYDSWTLVHKSSDSDVSISNGRSQGKNLVVHIDGINDRTSAEELVGAKIFVSQQQLEKLDDDEFYWRDLIGLTVSTIDGVDLGKVDWLFETGNNDVMVIAGDKERLVPFIQGEFVKAVDLEAGTIIVDWDPDF